MWYTRMYRCNCIVRFIWHIYCMVYNALAGLSSDIPRLVHHSCGMDWIHCIFTKKMLNFKVTLNFWTRVSPPKTKCFVLIFVFFWLIFWANMCHIFGISMFPHLEKNEWCLKHLSMLRNGKKWQHLKREVFVLSAKICIFPVNFFVISPKIL